MKTASSGQPRFWTLIPAAGVGQRFGAERPKQYEPLSGKPLLLHTLERVSRWPEQAGIMVVVGPGDSFWPEIRQTLPAPVLETTGGADRVDSVIAGLEALTAAGASPDDWVLVHDAARPGVRTSDVARLMAKCRRARDGGLLAVAARDTLHASADGNAVAGTIDRRTVWQAQTPQCFPLDSLLTTLLAARHEGNTVTDEAGAMAAAGFRVQLVEGHWSNVKLTVPEDRSLMEWVLTHDD